MYCIKTVCSFYARKTAAEALKKLIELFPNYDLQLNYIIDHFYNAYGRLYNKKGN